MSLRGFRVLPHVSGGRRYVLGAAIVSSSYGTHVSTGPPPPSFTWTGDIWASLMIWSTGTH
jgi:hypothetical protein